MTSNQQDFVRNRDGASAVEFAMVLPMLLSVLFGLLTYGSYFAASHAVQQLAAEAARAAVGGLSDAERASLARANVSANAPAYPLIASDRLVIANASTDASGNIFTVSLRYDASNMLMFNLPNFVPTPEPTIVRAAVIQRGGY